MDSIINSIETYRDDLSDKGIQNVNIEDMSADSVDRESIKIHTRTVTYSFYFVYDRTRSY